MPTKVRECPGQEVENGSWREDGEIRNQTKWSGSTEYEVENWNKLGKSKTVLLQSSCF